MVVTWGPPTVHTFGSSAQAPGTTPAPAAPASTGFSSFSNPSPAPASGGGIFGSSSSAPAPTGGLFGSPAPAGGSSLFGTPAPAGGGGLFGSAPAPSGGLFGSAPAPSGGLFGSAPATGGGLFGSPAPAPAGGGLFGSAPASGGLFGQPSQQQQQQQQQNQPPQIPAFAALQAHIDASARNEEARVVAAMTTIHKAYTGSAVVAETDTKSSPFTTVLYNPATPQQRQLLSSVQTVDGQTHYPIAPPKPLQISNHDWNEAVVRNPDSQNYMPIEIVGAEALQARVLWHQKQADQISKQMELIGETQTTLRERHASASLELQQAQRRHEQQRKKLLELMKKVEIARCYNHSLQHAEGQAAEKLARLHQTTEQLRLLISNVQARAQQQQRSSSASEHYHHHRGVVVDESRHQQHLLLLQQYPSQDYYSSSISDEQRFREQQQQIQNESMKNVELPNPQQLQQILQEHRAALSKLTMDVKKDMQDVHLIQERVTSRAQLPY